MLNEEFKIALNKRIKELHMSYRDIQEHTGLGYNTVRRVFKEPMNCRIRSVLQVLQTMECELVFAVKNHIGDELEIEEHGPVAE